MIIQSMAAWVVNSVGYSTHYNTAEWVTLATSVLPDTIQGVITFKALHTMGLGFLMDHLLFIQFGLSICV